MEQQLVELVAQKTGISQDQAQTAVQTVVGFLKGRLPEPLSGQLDKFVDGGGQGQGQTLASKIPGL
ncbi:MAG TPA: DUF2267 domain-containing protein [Gammaproteobacteria bacterium]|nr:DUF2267 domain-containing protein [Gammaproteobacteria bacterium]